LAPRDQRPASFRSNVLLSPPAVAQECADLAARTHWQRLFIARRFAAPQHVVQIVGDDAQAQKRPQRRANRATDSFVIAARSLVNSAPWLRNIP